MTDSKKYILTLDEGTTSARALITDKQGNIIAVEQSEFTQYFPKEGWVEHDEKIDSKLIFKHSLRKKKIYWNKNKLSDNFIFTNL